MPNHIIHGIVKKCRKAECAAKCAQAVGSSLFLSTSTF